MSRNVTVARGVFCLFVLAIAGAAANADPRVAVWTPPGTFQPAVSGHEVLPIDAVDKVVEPRLDTAALLAEDATTEALGGAPRYAVPMTTEVRPGKQGTWEPLDADRMVWRLHVIAPGAVSINFGFTQFKLPPGAQLMIYSADQSHVIRPFTADDNSDLHELWTPPVKGSEAVIEMVVPNEHMGDLDLLLGSVNVGYKPFMIPRSEGDGNPTELSGACNVDVVCPQGAPWADQIKAVAVISTGGSTFCTGFMVNDVPQDRKSYFMTASHCPLNSGNAASLVVFWNYQNTTCRPVGSPASGGPGDGSLAQFQTGSTWRASSSASDFTLVELSAMPNPAWNVAYAGWDRQGLSPPSGACIHHPNTDEKRISFYDIAVRPDRPSHDSSWPCSAFPGPGDGSHITVYWSLGVTEPGSSGSPLFDNNKRIIGQLHGGPSACNQSGDGLSDCYGRFSRSWTGGGTSSTRLSNWLDPASTGALFVDTVVGGGLNVSPAGPTLSEGVFGGPFSNPSTVYTISNTTATAANYSVTILGGGTAPLLLNGGAGPLSGSVPAGGPSVNVTVSLDASANSLPGGTYSTTVRFQDTTNNITFDRVHNLEIGLTNITVTPANGLSSGGPVGGPFGATQVYTITSTKPTPVNINVSANQPWISLNGGPGPVTATLSGVGANTTVTVGYSAAANALGAGLYSGLVTVSNTSGGTGGTTRSVQLDVGRYSYAATDVPQSINDNQTITSSVTVPDDYCIGDVNVDLDITHTYIGDLVVDLISPTGVVVRLHNRTGGGTDNIVATYDDGVFNPDGPGTLADFNNTPVQGVWQLVVSDQAGQDTGTLNSWTLKIAAAPGACVPPQLVYSYPMNSNPGWTTQGGWAFGTPLGSGGDPSSGYTGTNVYGYNLSGQYANGMAATEWLTSTAINCTGLTGTKLKFRRWLGVESSSYDHAYVDVSNNGTAWTRVFSNPASAINESSWSLQSINISAVADNQATVYVRWGLGPTDGSVTYQGWNIDDVEIWAVIPDPCQGVIVGDTDGNGQVNGGDVQSFVKTLLNPGGATPAELCAADVLDDNVVNTADVAPMVNLLLGL